jgi:uncharacterized membrane protein YeaQ/YmgE (transglycosylase-associated protein family)
MFHYLWMLIVGIVVGILAKFIVPGQENLGLLMTGVLGIAGSYVGGLVTQLFSKPTDGKMFHPAGIFFSVLGAVALLFAYKAFFLT